MKIKHHFYGLLILLPWNEEMNMDNLNREDKAPCPILSKGYLSSLKIGVV